MTRKLILSVFVLALISVGCQKSGQMDQILNENPFASSGEAYILKDAAIEDAIELVDYEIDFFTAPLCGTYESGMNRRNGQMGGASSFGGRYNMEECPNIMFDSTDNVYPKTIT
ncbi:hypothetical protein ACFLRR_03690, partial [Bacteroidota bacterium]